jgi:hypothetical protein
MSCHDIPITRTQAELLVTLLEDNYKSGMYEPSGEGADLAAFLREEFGMCPQPEMVYSGPVEEFKDMSGG